jgi:hypothetical protein
MLNCDFHYQDVNCFNNVDNWSATIFGDNPVLDGVESREVAVSADHLNWAEISRKGGILPYSHYQVQSLKATQQPATHTGNCFSPYGGQSRARLSGDAGAITYITIQSSPPDTVVNLDALLQGAAAEAQSLGWDILVDLVESPKTVALFYQWYRKFRDRKKHIRKLVWKSFRDPHTKRLTKLSNLSRLTKARMLENEFLNLWMESRYGWRPLVYSAVAISDAMSAWTDTPEFRIVRARRREIVTESTQPVFTAQWARSEQVANPVIESNSVHKRTVTGRGYFIGKIEATQIRESSLNLNPFSTGLELMPYEFVLGWFFNHMDAARAHWPSAQFTQSALGVSTLTEEVLDIGFYHQGSSKKAHSAGGRLVLNQDTYLREPRTDVPWDLLYRPKLSVAKLIDLKALFLKNAFGDMTPTFRKINRADKHWGTVSSQYPPWAGNRSSWRI